jgi:hypothetical protein
MSTQIKVPSLLCFCSRPPLHCRSVISVCMLPARSIVNSYTESGRKQIHWYVVRGKICGPVTEFRPEISNSCSLFDSVRGHAFCKLGKCVKSLFEPQVSKPEVYHQKIWSVHTDFELSGGRTETLGGPRVEGTWPIRLWGSTPFGIPVVTMRTTRFNIQQFTFSPHCIYVFCVNLRTNGDYFSIQH